jgi:fermentation-respiration switch protein FrsA (DUF1100 family)
MKRILIATIAISIWFFAGCGLKQLDTKKIEFTSGGEKIVGVLHIPKDFSEKKTYEAVVVTGSWTTVKEQMPNLYAKKLAEKGFLALTFDFRNYGESSGTPRNFEDPNKKAIDIANAVSYLQTLPFVQKQINGLAICASSGYMSQAMSEGLKLHRVAFIAPWLHDATIAEMVYGGKDGVKVLKEKADSAKTKFEKTNVVEYVLGVSDTDKTAAMFGLFDYYLNPKRGGIKEWGNQFALLAWRGWLDFNPIAFANSITTPILIVHSKDAAIPMGAEAFS